MIVKRMFGALGIGLFLIALSVPLQAQGRYKVRNLASNLNNRAHEAWLAMQDARNSMDLDDNPSARRLYWSLRDFNRRASRFAQESREPWESPATLRNQAQQLVNQAARIDNLMVEANIPDSVRDQWFSVDSTVENLAGVYNLPYERERGLARRDYDDYGD